MKAVKNSWILILFSLPFAAVGIGVLCFGIIPVVYDWNRAQSWQPVSATLTAADLEIHQGDDSKTYEATASYRYIYAGMDYESQRVAIETGSDNVGSFQEDLGYRLKLAYQQQNPIQVWVNPDKPAEAVIDRSLRLSLIAFKMIFVIIFGGLGLGLLYFCLRKADKFIANTNPAQPWLAHREWVGNRIGSNQKITMRFAWIVTIIWNLISFPILFVIPREVAAGNYPALIALLFPIAGVGFLYWAINVTRDWRRFGEVSLQLDPFPGALGGDVGGSLILPVRAINNLHFYIQLSCINSYESSSGKNRETRERLIWQEDGVAEVGAGKDQITLTFLFHVPAHLPASEEHSDNYNHWRLQVESKNPDIPFSRQYSIPVYATAARSQLQIQESSEHPAIQALEENTLETVCKLDQVPGGVELYFRPLRNLSAKLTLLLLGAIFGGAGILMLKFSDAPIFFSGIFLAIGSLCTGIGIYGVGNSLRIRLDQHELRYQRRLFGIVIRNFQISRSEVVGLQLVESYSSQTGSKHEKVFAIKALLKSGKKINVAESLRGQGVAELMLETLNLLCGVMVESKAL